MTTQPKRRRTQLELTQARLRVAMSYLDAIAAMRPRTLPVRYAASAHAFLVFCCSNHKTNAEVSDGGPLTHESTEARTRRSLH
jgi:hypothetical protein